MFKPPYWLYDNIKLYDESIEKLRSINQVIDFNEIVSMPPGCAA